ncbi:MAG: MFS transporter [Gemmatimonadetes bacterium]|nr:MFS transporter [Gemmatimonadota bacterium]
MTGDGARARIYWAAGLRSGATGLTGVILALALAERGVGVESLGLVVGAGLAGGAVGTALVAYYGDRLGWRAPLMVATALTGAGYMAVAHAPSAAFLPLAAFLGMLNGFGRDRGPAQTLDLSVLACVAADSDRTRVYSRYTFIQDVAGAIGALGAALPAIASAATGSTLDAAYRGVFAGLAVVSGISVVLYAGVHGAPAHAAADLRSGAPRDPVVRRRLGSLAALTALDSVGGGFLAGAILSYWFFRRFGLAPEALGALFFAARGLNALSYLAAERLASRFGLIRTMVFTHLPSSGFLLALPLVASPWAAIALFLAREALVQMDVPTRQSYIAAVVPAGARTFALGLTGIVRSAGWALGAPVAGLAMGALGIAAPLYGGGLLKIAYDLALFGAFRHVRPPEEERAGPGH